MNKLQTFAEFCISKKKQFSYGENGDLEIKEVWQECFGKELDIHLAHDYALWLQLEKYDMLFNNNSGEIQEKVPRFIFHCLENHIVFSDPRDPNINNEWYKYFDDYNNLKKFEKSAIASCLDYEHSNIFFDKAKRKILKKILKFAKWCESNNKRFVRPRLRLNYAEIQIGVFWLEFYNEKLSDQEKEHYVDLLLYYLNYEKLFFLPGRINEVFITILDKLQISPSKITEKELDTFWYNFFGMRLRDEKFRQKFKRLTHKYNFIVSFIQKLPSINTQNLTIYILESAKDKMHDYWKDYLQFLMHNPEHMPKLRKRTTRLHDIDSYQSMLHEIDYLDESSKKERERKQAYLLFFLYLVKNKVALLPCDFIFNADTFIASVLSKERLESFIYNDYKLISASNQHLIDDEMKTNSKAKFIFFLRFLYMVNDDIETIKEIIDDNITEIRNIYASKKSAKMFSVNENPIRRCLFWMGAINISQTRAESEKIILSPIELLSENIISPKMEYIKKAFIRYFSNQKNNQEQRKYSRFILALLNHINDNFEVITIDSLKDFFETTTVSSGDKIIITSKFMQYLNENDVAMSSQQSIQMICFQALESDEHLRGSFPKSFLHTLYKEPKNRKIARLAFDKNLLEKMKKICVFDPPKDNYYKKTHFDKSQYMWKHFDKVEPQLPIMLLLNLCLPWRSEHIKSLDRDQFIVTDQYDNIIGFQLTTDKNQNNNIFIEREFFEFSFKLYDNQNNSVDVMRLLKETIEYSKVCFPALPAEFRKENQQWGKIKPILCSNRAKGFISHSTYSGYYYKVLLKALYLSDYDLQQIQRFVQLSPEGKRKFKQFPSSYQEIEKLSAAQINTRFNSEYFSPHSLRKSNITHLVQDRKSLEFILKLSGHTAFSTVLQVYIDYDLLARLNIKDDIQSAIENNFRITNTRTFAKEIIDIYQKYHTLSSTDIQKKLEQENLFFSIILLDKEQKIIKKNDINKLAIVIPQFWEHLSTGICTNALNCPSYVHNRCSICPFFLTGPKFFSAINSKIMQITTKLVEYFKIIDKQNMEEYLNDHEAIIYEEEAELDLAELQGYLAITKKLNTEIYNTICHSLSKEEQSKLPAISDFDIIQASHVPYLEAQLEIYKIAKQNSEANMQTEHAVSELYKKIMELIIMGQLPRELFLDNFNSHEDTIDLFIEILDSNKLNGNKSLIEYFQYLVC
ncbi:hypothetical protein MLC35_11300 [Sulfurimonas sp. NW7]|uniref:hypothetical protein n=1 Tax=Sulfurimonas sp. NW7 TaxID=2922727 RepID=UPI003DA99B7F